VTCKYENILKISAFIDSKHPMKTWLWLKISYIFRPYRSAHILFQRYPH